MEGLSFLKVDGEERPFSWEMDEEYGCSFISHCSTTSEPSCSEPY